MKILLPLVIQLRGSCHGITTTQIERTEFSALYKRSDGYFECFRIKVTKHRINKDGIWVNTGDTIERYPSDECFGATAWCGNERKIRELYEQINAISNCDVLDI